MVYIILGKGFEEAEALVPCDLLRRAGVEVRLAGIGGLEIQGSHGITVRADCVVEETDFSNAEMLILPGGLGGVASIRASEAVLSAVRALHEKECFLAAICAAPTVLADLGITEGKKATCYPGMENEMGSANMQDAPVVQDGKLITGRAAGASFDFALALITALRGEAAAKKVAAGVVYCGAVR
ncbi:MAG: DJ-1 family glyoxalase III [Faecousia sp.]